jgi:DNA-binding MarR family transcriptional regulator
MSASSSPRDEAVQRLFDALVVLGRSLRARGSDWAYVDPELSRSDIHTLGVIAQGTCRPGQVAEKLCLDRSVISRQVAALAQHGLVGRVGDPEDGRAELVSLTEAGRERLRHARDLLCAELGERLDLWDAAGLDHVADTLAELSRRLQHPLTNASTKPAPQKEGHV